MVRPSEGSKYDRQRPPARAALSLIATSSPARVRLTAADRPASPAPTTFARLNAMPQPSRLKRSAARASRSLETFTRTRGAAQPCATIWRSRRA